MYVTSNFADFILKHCSGKTNHTVYGRYQNDD